MSRILIAGLVGGVIVFVWGAFSHTVFPIGEMGLSTIPNEDAVIAALASNIREPGLYLYPSEGMGGEMTPEQMKAMEQKYKTGPAGLLSYRPVGGELFDPKQLGTEVLSNILACIVAAFVLSLIPGTFGRRLLVATLLGLFAWLSISISHYNWYGFAPMYTLAEGIDQVASFFLAGLAMGKIVPSSAIP